MLSFFLFLLANAILLIIGYSFLSLYSGYRQLHFGEKIVSSFIVGIFLNFFVFFIAGWSQLGFSWIIPSYIIFVVLIIGYALFMKKIVFKKISISVPSFRFHPKNILLIFLGGVIAFRVFFSFFQATVLPAYFDDEKGNWNLKSKVIFHAGTIGIDKDNTDTYVGGGGHKEYPLAFILYKVYIAKFLGGWNDHVMTLIHPLFFYLSIGVIFFYLFSSWTFRILGLYLLSAIPLVSWHAGVSYFDLTIATLLLTVYFLFYRFSETKNKIYLWVLVWVICLAVNTKNEGAVLMVPSLLPLAYLILKEKILRSWNDWWPILIPIALSIPHLVFRMVYDLSFNPHSSSASYGWHSEGPGLLWNYFFSGGSYNIVWYILPVFIILGYKKLTQGNMRYISMSIFLFLILALSVFLFTNNFQFLLDQTTIHRTMLIFLIPMLTLALWSIEKDGNIVAQK